MRRKGVHPWNAHHRRRVLELPATYRDHEAVLAEYPFLEAEDLQQALHFAAANLDDERIETPRVA